MRRVLITFGSDQKEEFCRRDNYRPKTISRNRKRRSEFEISGALLIPLSFVIPIIPTIICQNGYNTIPVFSQTRKMVGVT